MRERRERLIAVRFAILRIIFLAELVLAMAAGPCLRLPDPGRPQAWRRR
jgi:hypothetical protein